MNPGTAEPSPFVEPPPAESWGWKKFFLIVLFVSAAHLAFVFLLGAKKTVPPRAVKNVPVFHLADNASELVRLTDPTLFALPHVEDFPAGIMAATPTETMTEFRWTEPPPFLGLNPANLGGDFNAFMQTNRVEQSALKFKPEPQLFLPAINLEPALPQKSTLEISGALAHRRRLDPAILPSLPWNDVIAPSKVQVFVDTAGNVVSTVLLPSDNDLEAAGRAEIGDSNALNIARTLRFAPADKPTFGEMIFTWHTVPTNAP